MNTPRWQTDEYGTSILHVDEDSYVWIQGRRPYCDRGHWEWGTVGLPHTGPSPSYYFMDLDVAREQVERWLAATQGLVVPDPDNTSPTTGQLFSHPVGAANGWRWARQGNRLLALADEAVLELSWDASNPNEVLLTAKGIESLDDSDRFPRHYLGLATAVKEVETFLAWRLKKVPHQIPGPLDHVPMDPVLLPVQEPVLPRPPRRRKP